MKSMKVMAIIIYMIWPLIVNAAVGNKKNSNSHSVISTTRSDFQSLLIDTNSTLKGKLDVYSLDNLLKRLNVKCLSAKALHSSLGGGEGLSEELFRNASLIITYYKKFGVNKTSCNSSETLISPTVANDRLFGSQPVCQKQMDALMEFFEKTKLERSPSEKCVGTTTSMFECTTNFDKISQGVTRAIIAVGSKSCPLPTLPYLEEKLKEYLSTKDGSLNETAFSDLLDQLNIGRQPKELDDHDEHDNHLDHNHQNDDEDQETNKNHENSNDNDENHEDHEDHEDHENHMHSNDNNENHEDHEDHENHMHSNDNNENHEDDEDHENHMHSNDNNENHEDDEDHENHMHSNDHNENVNDTDKNNLGENNEEHVYYDYDDKDDYPEHQEHGERNNSKNSTVTAEKSEEVEIARNRQTRNVEEYTDLNKCFTKNELMSIAISARNTRDGSMQFTPEDVINLCPAMLQQIVSGACVGEESHKHDASSGSTAEYTTAMKYGYGTASVLIISLLALGGLMLFPGIGSVTYKLTMQFFIALGVGTLTGDALLHLIPEVVGLHGHEKEEGEGGHESHKAEEEDKTYLYKLLVVVGGIYMFYLFENVLRLWNQLKNSNITFHHHDDDHVHSHMEEGKGRGEHHTIASVLPTIDHEQTSSEKRKPSKPLNSTSSKKQLTEESSGERNVFWGITPVGIMVLIGDVLHNFGDGLALGVAFSSSWVGGVSASIAIFCHELPHEFGDFAIYLKNGMSKWKAVCLNFVAACFAFIGLYIGLSVAENPEVRGWLLAIIAGMFLYIALVDVLHEMTEEQSKDHPVLQFFLQNLGLCLGWAILLVLALFEDQLGAAIDG